jgi:hypothetical protein
MGEPRTVTCATHGEMPATFTCRHVALGVACGFHADEPDADQPWPDAWCDACEDVYREQGDWTDIAEEHAQIQLLCSGCYEVARASNRDVPALARGAATRLTCDEADALVHRAVHAVQDLQAASNRRWGWLDLPRWDHDPVAGTLVFSDPARPDATVIGDVDLVGSFSTRTDSFQWSWQTSPSSPLTCRAARLRAFGEVRGVERLTTPNFACEEVDAWEMTALAAYLLGADGVYRPPFDHLRWFMLVRNLRRVT